MCLWFAKSCDAGVHKQSNWNSTAITYQKHIRMRRDIIRIICAEDLHRRLHADMHWRLASTMLLVSDATLLITGVSLDSTHDIPSRETHQHCHCNEQNSRFLSHV